jgi:hypothetical protein
VSSDRDHLEKFLTAIDASPTTLERPVCRGWVGDWQITGKQGHVLTDGTGYLLYANTPERDAPHPDRVSGAAATEGRQSDRKLCYGSARKWTSIKAQLGAFTRLIQNGDDEGCFYLDRLPTQAEAGPIRDALGIRRRRAVTEETKARLRSQLEHSRAFIKSIDKAPSIAPNGETDAEVETESRED